MLLFILKFLKHQIRIEKIFMCCFNRSCRSPGYNVICGERKREGEREIRRRMTVPDCQKTMFTAVKCSPDCLLWRLLGTMYCSCLPYSNPPTPLPLSSGVFVNNSSMISLWMWRICLGLRDSPGFRSTVQRIRTVRVQFLSACLSVCPSVCVWMQLRLGPAAAAAEQFFFSFA